MINQCPDSGGLQAYCDGELALDEKLVVEKHLAGCPFCTRLVANMMSENNWINSLFVSENQVLSLNAAGLSQRLYGDMGIKWGWVVTWFLLLGLTAVIIGSSWLTDTSMVSWLMGISPRLVFTAVRQQILADGWRLIVTSGLPWGVFNGLMPPFSLEVALIGSGMGLAAIKVLSRKLVRYEEIIG